MQGINLVRGPDKIAIAERTLINGSTKLQGAKQDFVEEHLTLTWRAGAPAYTAVSQRIQRGALMWQETQLYFRSIFSMFC